MLIWLQLRCHDEVAYVKKQLAYNFRWNYFVEYLSLYHNDIGIWIWHDDLYARNILKTK